MLLYIVFGTVYYFLLIGSSGDFLPNNTAWFQTFAPTGRQESFDITRHVLSTMGAVIEANQILNGPSIKSEQIETLSLLLSNCNAQREQLRYINTRLVLDSKYTRDDTVKNHQLKHYVPQTIEVGIHKQAWDTGLGESNHKKSKVAHDATSKRGGVNLRELALREEKIALSQRLISRILIPPKTKTEFTGQIFTSKSDKTYHIIDQLGYQRIIFIDGEWKVSDTNRNSLFIHPFLDKVSFSDLLTAYIDSNLGNNTLVHLLRRAFESSKNVTVCLLKGIKAIGNEALHIHDYHIRSTSTYPFYSGDTSQLCQAYSFIEIQFEGDAGTNVINPLAKVMAILKLSSNTKAALCFIVALLEPLKHDRNAYYPFTEFQYKLNCSGMIELQVITLNNIIGPVFVMPIVSKSCFDKESKQIGFRKDTFYGVGSTRIRNKNSIIKYDLLSNKYPKIFLSVDKINDYNESLVSDV